MARPASCRIGRGVPVTQVRAVQRPAPLSFQRPGGGSQLKGPPRCDHYGQRVQWIQSAGRAPKEVGKSIVGRKSPGKRNPQTGSKGQGGVPRHRWGHVGADQRGRIVGARWPSVEVRIPPPEGPSTSTVELIAGIVEDACKYNHCQNAKMMVVGRRDGSESRKSTREEDSGRGAEACRSPNRSLLLCNQTVFVFLDRHEEESSAWAS